MNPVQSNAAILMDFHSIAGSRIPAVDDVAAEMNRAWDTYHGKLKDPLITKVGQPSDNVKFNGASIVVDTGVAFLFGKGFAYTLHGDDAPEDGSRTPAETYLDKLWVANDKDEFIQKVAINGAVCGQSYIKIHLANPYPKLYEINPANMTVVTAADDPSYVLQYVIRWSGVKSDGKPLDFRQVISRQPAQDPTDDSQSQPLPEYWKILDQQAQTQTRFMRAEQVRWETIHEEDWNYPFPPIVSCQNLPKPSSYTGKPDLSQDVIHLIEAINSTLSNIKKILRFHAHPKTWSRGLSESQVKQLNINTEQLINLPGDTATLQNLEMQSDLASSITYYWALRSALYELTRVPEIASGKIADLQYMSAMAMQILYGPLIEKTNAKRITYGGMIDELHRRLLIIAGMAVADATHIVWPEVYPRDAMVESQTAINLQLVGVSQDTILEGMGFNPKKERERRALDQQEAVAHAGALATATAPPPPVSASAAVAAPDKSSLGPVGK
jgi:hypothetical protein